MLHGGGRVIDFSLRGADLRRIPHRIGAVMTSANVDTAAVAVDRCVSCDAPLSGPYCSRCGERTLEPDALTLRHFLVHTVVQELLNVDGALWRSLQRILLPPRARSLPDAGGRRRPFVN